ncbi:MAG: ATP-binding protein [Kofleriaceae bacterium]
MDELEELRAHVDATERKLRAMHAISHVLAEDSSSEVVPARILAALGTALGYSLATFWVPIENHLVPIASWAADDITTRWDEVTSQQRFELGKGLPGRVWKEHTPIWVEDITTMLPRSTALETEHIRSGLGFPLVAGSELLGVIDLFTRRGEGPDDELVEVLRTIGAHLGQFFNAARAQEQLRREVEQSRATAATLEKANAELDQYAYAASHDLRAPLRGITNLATWIEEDLGTSTPKKVKEHIALLKSRASRMDKLINGLLELARIGRVRQRPERIDVTELLHDTIDLLSPPETSRVLVIGAMPTLVAERVALQQVFLNLIGNAIQHSARKDVVVKVSAVDSQEEAEFAIADNGVGIPPEHQQRVWQIFQTLDPRDVTETTGIGLSIVKKQVEGCGGRTWIDPQVREGATLRFTWPKKPTARDQPTA